MKVIQDLPPTELMSVTKMDFDPIYIEDCIRLYDSSRIDASLFDYQFGCLIPICNGEELTERVLHKFPLIKQTDKDVKIYRIEGERDAGL